MAVLAAYGVTASAQGSGMSAALPRSPAPAAPLHPTPAPPPMPATPFYCNWCRERVGVYHAGDAPFTPDGAPPHNQSGHLRAGVIAEAEDGPVAAYPCPACGRSNLLQLPASTGA